MAITDPISDMLTRIRNALKARYQSVDVPGSKLKIEMAKILKKEGYVKEYTYIEDNKQGKRHAHDTSGFNGRTYC